METASIPAALPDHDRQQPYSLEAEISVLGGMLIDNDAVAKAIEIVDDSMFHREANRRLFRGMVRLFERGDVVDVITLNEELKNTDELESAGGASCLAELLDEQSARFATGEGAVPASVMNAILEALDQEIERWERQAGEDPDARAVLRTFLGLREILWEFGLRRDSPSRGSGSTSRPRSKPARKNPGELEDKARPPRRVQRVDVQG